MTLTETVRSETNLNTWITLAGFCLVIGGSVMVYGQERAENRLRHAEAERRILALDAALQRNASERVVALNAQEARLRALESSIVRGDARIEEIYRIVQRIDQQLERMEP